MKYPQSIQKLIDIFTKLPSVGPKTAERYVFYLLAQKKELLQEFAQYISELKEKTKICQKCNSISTNDICDICSQTNRDTKTISIVESTQDMISIENTKNYNGLYFILGGNIDTLEGKGPEDLPITKFLKRIDQESFTEIILALSPTLEGETTSMYLTKAVKNKFPNTKISRIAKGMPVGSSLEYADPHTLSNAMKYRNTL